MHCPLGILGEALRVHLCAIFTYLPMEPCRPEKYVAAHAAPLGLLLNVEEQEVPQAIGDRSASGPCAWAGCHSQVLSATL